MLNTILKVIVLVVIVAGLSYAGLSIWAGSCKTPDNGGPAMPCSDDAGYSFYIKNTGGLYLSDDYEQYGNIVGERSFTLHGFWQVKGSKYQKVSGDITLDEHIFGEITVEKRTGG